MAPGPHVLVATKGDISLTSKFDNEEEDENDEEDGFVEYKYYESDKILGLLYRDIDELQIFDAIQRNSSNRLLKTKRDFIDELWLFVQNRCYMTQWNHHMELATEIQDA